MRIAHGWIFSMSWTVIVFFNKYDDERQTHCEIFECTFSSSGDSFVLVVVVMVVSDGRRVCYVRDDVSTTVVLANLRHHHVRGHGQHQPLSVCR